MGSEEPLRGSTTPRDAAKTEERRRECPRCAGAVESLVGGLHVQWWKCRECRWASKECLSCGALVDQAHLAPEEPERCADCADVVTEVQDGDADLPDAFLIVWPEGTKAGHFTSAYENEEIARAVVRNMPGARIVRFVPEARPVDLSPLLQMVQRHPTLQSMLQGALSHMAASFAMEQLATHRQAKRDAAGICRSSRAFDDEVHDCALHDGHDGEHRATDGTTWDSGPFRRTG